MEFTQRATVYVKVNYVPWGYSCSGGIGSRPCGKFWNRQPADQPDTPSFRRPYTSAWCLQSLPWPTASNPQPQLTTTNPLNSRPSERKVAEGDRACSTLAFVVLNQLFFPKSFYVLTPLVIYWKLERGREMKSCGWEGVAGDSEAKFVD